MDKKQYIVRLYSDLFPGIETWELLNEELCDSDLWEMSYDFNDSYSHVYETHVDRDEDESDDAFYEKVYNLISEHSVYDMMEYNEEEHQFFL